jgi:GTP-binding protein Era
MSKSKFGYVSIVGKPNVGKSTLLNQLIGQRVSVVNKKSNTTRDKILGLYHGRDYQIAFLDTPGFQNLNQSITYKQMRRQINMALDMSDIVIYLIDPYTEIQAIQSVMSELARFDKSIIIVINKIDLLKNKNELLPFTDDLSKVTNISDFAFISSLKNKGIDQLVKLIVARLPMATPEYEDNKITDVTLEFRIKEEIRNAALNALHDEIPYEIDIEINSVVAEKNLIAHATIWAPKKSYKSILIGKSGRTIKAIGSEARKNIETWNNKKSSLYLQVNVRKS